MEIIINFFRDTVLMQWLMGERILELFNQYFLFQSDTNKVLIIIGFGLLSFLGALKLIKSILKMTLLWVKVVLLIMLIYYLFVVILGIDIWAFLP